MQRLKDKLHIPKAQSFHEVGSLETIVRDSIYLAWPGASFDSSSGGSDKKESRRYLQRQPDAIEEEDDDNELHCRKRKNVYLMKFQHNGFSHDIPWIDGVYM
ncbi:uncharacterized protein LOC121383538 [Gigantopelta aegis]|uniref:uncharacterized protein LOC121383538 n=1 Tax=Gigantopelta aegis TaxID=1735272 RepID=UPI001B88AF72|nr:uncharacterized protein LOC121383538 [Gigantopelta aegis]